MKQGANLIIKDAQKKLSYLEVPFEIKNLHDDEEDDNFFIFEGLASTFNDIDLGDDVIKPGAFQKSLLVRTPIILWQHRTSEPIGMPILIEERVEGLFIRARLPKDDTLVSGRVIPQMRVGSIRKMSIGFDIADSETEGRLRILKEINLWEVSLVTFPMNENANVTDFKTVTAFNGSLPVASSSRVWDSTAAMRRFRQFSGSNEAPSSTYKNFFLWFDSTAPDEFGSYKLPFVDIVDGEPNAIPRGLSAARGRLDQTDIPENDKSRVLANIERYQEKIDSETSGKMFNLEDVIGIKDKKDLRNFFKSTDIFTKQAREHMLAITFKSSQGDPDDDNKDQGELGHKSVAELLDAMKL